MHTIIPFESQPPRVRDALVEDVTWITNRSCNQPTLYTPGSDFMAQAALDSLLIKILNNYIKGATQFTEESVATEPDPYAGKREVIYLPIKGTLDRGITRRR
ncbi:MAG: hypothetical protein MN733_41185 [Nitrososphaera sp.]|nr:hypothetical protein [Nitrososphaera sp.]